MSRSRSHLARLAPDFLATVFSAFLLLVAGCRDITDSPRSLRSNAALHKDQYYWSDAPGAIISNGTIMLGVGQMGQLGVSGGPAFSMPFTAHYTDYQSWVGLRPQDNSAEAFTRGMVGDASWGIADAISSAGAGVTNTAYFNRAAIAPTLESFSSSDSTATSVVKSAGPFRVTHEYRPMAGTRAVYEVLVTVENTSATQTDVRYRRIIPWLPGVNGGSGDAGYSITVRGSEQPSVTDVGDTWCGDPQPPAASVRMTGDDCTNGTSAYSR